MKRVQDAIYDQLSKHKQKLELELREKEEEAKKGVSKREDIGVELYNLQQQLARSQAMLEGTEDNYSVIRSLREEADRHLKHVSGEFKKEIEKKKQQQKNCNLD